MSDAHVIRSPETWAAVRDSYLAGVPAPDLCEQHGIPRSTLHARAKAEGWRRLDQPEAGLPYVALDDDPSPPRTAAQLADATWLGADRAIARGHAADAERWMRLHRQFRGLVAEEAREQARAEAEKTRADLKLLDDIGALAAEGCRETEALIRALDRLPPAKLAAEAGSGPAPAAPPAAAAPDGLDSLDSISESKAAPNRLRRSLLQAQLNKALQRRDHAGAARARAKLAALDGPKPPPGP